mmetsp:Transcript_45430/g.135543  ORF Transcript_45430/g.135543 Transcript_45430/m.135543 type:complete len:238 (+) Transcript_45430:715-1428(+)
MDDVGELVDALAGVVGMHVLILRPKVAPLEAVHRSQVAFLTVRKPKAVEELAAGVAVPDVHPAVTQLVGVGGAADKPQQLLQHAAPKHALGGEQRERAPQVVARSAAEEGERAGAGAVGAEHTRADDAVHQVEVLLLVMLRCHGWWQPHGATVRPAESCVSYKSVTRAIVLQGLTRRPHPVPAGINLRKERVALSVGVYVSDVQRCALRAGDGGLVDLRTADYKGGLHAVGMLGAGK